MVEKTATGERPVAKARIMAWPFGTSVAADEQGRFELERGEDQGAVVLYRVQRRWGLAGFTTVSADADNGDVLDFRRRRVLRRAHDRHRGQAEGEESGWSSTQPGT